MYIFVCHFSLTSLLCRKNYMMTDINIWSSSLDEETIYSWMTCEEDSLIQEKKIVDWKTSNWTNENIQVESLNRSTVCFRKERRGRVYPFNSNKRSEGSKGRDFFEVIDFCHKLGGKIPVPQDLQTILQLRSKCGAAHPFTGWMIVGDSGVFRDPYTFQAIHSLTEKVWQSDSPDNQGGQEDCTELEDGLRDIPCHSVKSCVLCNVTDIPQFELRGADPQLGLDVREVRVGNKTNMSCSCGKMVLPTIFLSQNCNCLVISAIKSNERLR